MIEAINRESYFPADRFYRPASFRLSAPHHTRTHFQALCGMQLAMEEIDEQLVAARPPDETESFDGGRRMVRGASQDGLQTHINEHRLDLVRVNLLLATYRQIYHVSHQLGRLFKTCTASRPSQDTDTMTLLVCTPFT